MQDSFRMLATLSVYAPSVSMHRLCPCIDCDVLDLSFISEFKQVSYLSKRSSGTKSCTIHFLHGFKRTLVWELVFSRLRFFVNLITCRVKRSLYLAFGRADIDSYCDQSLRQILILLLEWVQYYLQSNRTFINL